jgi:hypothetical protein
VQAARDDRVPRGDGADRARAASPSVEPKPEPEALGVAGAGAGVNEVIVTRARDRGGKHNIFLMGILKKLATRYRP